MQEVMTFSHNAMKKRGIQIIKTNLELRHVALLYKTSNIAMIFEDKPN
jgi:hypothetical protein